MEAERLRWLERKERIEEKESKLADQLQARLYRNQGRQTQHKKETLRQTKLFKAEEDRLKCVAEVFDALKKSWRKDSKMLLNHPGPVFQAHQLNELAKATDIKMDDMFRKIADLAPQIIEVEGTGEGVGEGVGED